MEETNQAMAAVQQWQKWYRENKIVADPEEPLVAKDQRDGLHDTSNTAETLDDMPNLLSYSYDAKRNAFNDFSDILASYMSTLGGKELYKIFFEAAQEYNRILEAEHKQGEDLLNCLRYRTKG
jgi:hypothetical protein